MKLLILFLLISLGAQAQLDPVTKKGVKVFIVQTPAPIDTSDASGNYDIVLTHDANVSAGLYNADSVLVRTLFSGVRMDSGTTTLHWDGYADNGILAPEQTYHVRYISSNITYAWEGARIGNTSPDLTGLQKLRVFEPIREIAITGDTVYYALGYNEGNPSAMRTPLDSLGKKTWLLQLKKTDQGAEYVKTIGGITYYSGYDAYNNTRWFTFAINNTTGAEVTFSAGTPFQPVRGTLHSAISLTTNSINQFISGTAVNGNYIFIARGGIDSLYVLNRFTGAVVNTYVLDGVRKIDARNNVLWAAVGSNIVSYNITDSAITATGVSISLANPGAIAIRPTNDSIAVADIDNQVVRFFSNAGAEGTQLGTTGGYATSSAVTNYKYYWEDIRKEYKPYLAYTNANDLFVGDPANARMLKYTGRSWIETQMVLPNNYNCFIDPNDSARLFSDFLEFAIDYTKPLQYAWTLKNNWGYNYGSQYDAFNKIIRPVTLSNGKTYALVRQVNDYPVIELVPNGNIRYTGTIIGTRRTILKDGTLAYNPGTTAGFTSDVVTYPLTGFTSNNPVWSSTANSTTSTAIIDSFNAAPREGFRSNMITDNGMVVYFDYSKPDGNLGYGYKLGGVKKGTAGYKWQTARSTKVGYTGFFPKDGAFDGYNDVIFPGGSALLNGDNIFWGYHGENWKQSQLNKWNHVDAPTGLFIGQFGTANLDHLGEEGGYAEGSGNVIHGDVVKVADTLFLYHNDESLHGGVHRWKITGLNTSTRHFATTTSTNDTIATPGINLMAGLTSGTLADGLGWSRFPTTDITTNIESNYWQVTKGNRSYDPFKTVNISALYRQNIGDYSYRRDLGTNTGLNTWSLTGDIAFEGHTPTQAAGNAGLYVQVKDGAGLVIARFDLRGNTVGEFTDIKVNNQTLATLTNNAMQVITYKEQPFTIARNGSNITFTYANFSPVTTSVKIDSLADYANPITFELKFFNNTGPGDNFQRTASVQNLRFINTGL